MMNNKTSGIVIKRSNLGEADRILTIVSERLGKVKAIAKGVRKTKSKLAGHLEPFMLLDLQLFEGKTFFTVTGAVITEEFSKIHSDLKKTSRAFYVAELVDKFLQENQPSEKIFQLLLEALRIIEKEDKNFLLRGIELQLIEASGFRPQLYECVCCKSKIEAGKNFWDSVAGGIICSECNEKFRQGREITDDLIKIFRLVDRGNADLLLKIKPNSLLENEAETVLADYIGSILERDLASKRFLKEISSNK